MRLRTFSLAALLVGTAFHSASAHATLEQAEASPGPYKAVLRIPHGCDGQATNTVRIELPEGFISAKPMPKAGWQLETETGAYAETYSNHGNQVTEGVTSVSWSGGSLEDGHYDEFVVMGTLAGVESGDVLAFATTQTCADGEVAWTEIAAEGQDPHALDYPAPTVTISSSAHAEGHGGHGGGGHGGHSMKPTEQASATIGDLSISGAWVRATLPNQKVGGGYLTIENTGSDDDRLTAVSAPITERAEIHEMSMENDIMTMRRMDDGLAVPAGQSVQLEPGGLHLMFQDLDEPIQDGDTVPVTLTFERAGEVTVQMPVLPASAGRGGGHQP